MNDRAYLLDAGILSRELAALVSMHEGSQETASEVHRHLRLGIMPNPDKTTTLAVLAWYKGAFVEAGIQIRDLAMTLDDFSDRILEPMASALTPHMDKEYGPYRRIFA